MCGITASFDVKKLKDLINANNIRGTFSFSLALVDLEYNLQLLYRSFHDTRNHLLKQLRLIPNSEDNFYYISHNQAPTGNNGIKKKNFYLIHPAHYKNNYLYHNGILKQYPNEYLWDTEYLLQNIIDTNFECLNKINGSFACILIMKDGIYIFRNNSSILYYDEDLNLSSINYNESMIELESNKIFKLDLINRKLIHIQDFNSPDNGYAFV